MSFYSDEHEFIFIHIPKNAGVTFTSSCAKAFGKGEIKRFEKVAEQLGYKRDPALANHHTYKMIKDMSDKHNLGDFYKKYYKLCVIRNPWERMVSLYHHRLRKMNKMVNGKPRCTPQDKAVLKKGFIPWLLTSENVSDLVLTKTSQVEWIKDEEGGLVCDRIVDIKNYNKGINKAIKEADLPMLKLGHRNRGRVDSSDYKKYYNTKAKKYIEKYFEEDIDTFKFTF